MLKPLEHLLHWFGPDALPRVVLDLIKVLIVLIFKEARRSLKQWLARPKTLRLAAMVTVSGKVTPRLVRSI